MTVIRLNTRGSSHMRVCIVASHSHLLTLAPAIRYFRALVVIVMIGSNNCFYFCLCMCLCFGTLLCVHTRRRRQNGQTNKLLIIEQTLRMRTLQSTNKHTQELKTHTHTNYQHICIYLDTRMYRPT